MKERENPLLNLLFNIVIPVLVLNKGSHYMSPHWTLVIGLAFPVSYGLWDFLKKKKANYLSLLGILNVLMTGGLAIMQLEGNWFPLKEAAFPALIGIFVFGSSFSKRPFIKTLFLNPQMINHDLLVQKVKESQKESEFEALLKNSTLLLSLSFLLSATLNFLLAQHIFSNLNPSLSPEEKSALLNGQIAEMTKWSFIVILAPSILFLLGIFAYLLKGIHRLTGLKTEDIIPT